MPSLHFKTGTYAAVERRKQGAICGGGRLLLYLPRMQPFSLLIKAVGGACNLACDYCFYRGHPAGAMDAATLRRALDGYASLPFAGKSVTFQGGEPLVGHGASLLPIACEYPVEKALQTNATLVTDDLARFLAANQWLVGASLDGPPQMNRLRGDSFEAAVRGIRALERNGADYNLVTVVSKANVDRPKEVYRFLRDSFSTRFHQYIECTGPRDAITGLEWGRFLVGLFDEWMIHDSRSVSVRIFDSIVSQMVDGTPMQCSFAATCRQHLVVEHDGSVYPCDFHVSRELCLGNIRSTPLAEMAESSAYRAFAARKTGNLPPRCTACAYLPFCNGDCPRNRGTLCEGWSMFFAHALPTLQKLAGEVAFAR